MGLFDGLRKKALAKSFYNQANAYVRSEQFEDAIEAYKLALDCDPKFTRAYYNLGIAYGAVGQSEEAIWACKQTLMLDRNYLGAYYNLGVNYTDQGKLQEAIDSYEAFIRLAPNRLAPQINQAKDTIRDLKQSLASGSVASSSRVQESQGPLAKPDWCTFEDGSIPYPDPEQTVFFEEIEYGERIPFDDEERLQIEKETRFLATCFAGKEFRMDDAKTLWCGIASPGLRKLVRFRLDRGDVAAALSTCVKLVAVCPHDPSDWNLLSEIFAKKGEHEKAQACLGEANRRKS